MITQTALSDFDNRKSEVQVDCIPNEGFTCKLLKKELTFFGQPTGPLDHAVITQHAQGQKLANSCDFGG